MDPGAPELVSSPRCSSSRRRADANILRGARRAMVCARPWNADLIPPTSGRPYLPRRIHVDKGYRGHSYPNEFRVWISGQVRRVTKIIRREMKRRAAVEPVIGHMKAKHRKAVQLGRLEADRARLVEEVTAYAGNGIRLDMRPRRSATRPARSGTACSGWSRRRRSASRINPASASAAGVGSSAGTRAPWRRDQLRRPRIHETPLG